ncbi:MAG: radical SAM protein [Deltaproteobacteria bacterium]|jgi:radical SAM protein with 4Fe4S-binding SPASM domain|nr:radical SAM protein [Deltaproteobacteria bacterium]MBT4639144.1 radical SAM protein [Deltaproteobacteria bacterium]MBT7712740.1 radical SAM protein [Deltaproteobacteria bacterium]
MDITQLIRSCGLIPPKILTIMITNGCNLQCSHCWPDSRPTHLVQPVASVKIERIIREFVQTGTENLILTGGEPFTHPDLFKLLQSTCSMHELNQVQVQTNAVLLSDAIVDKVLGLNAKKLSFQVSLEGATPSTHDRVRGDGSYSRALMGIERLIKAGFKDSIQIALTETMRNFSEIPALLKLLESLGIRQFYSGTLVMHGRAETIRSVSPPTPDQYRDLIQRFQEDTEFRDLYQRNRSFTIAALEWSLDKPAGSDGCRFMEHCLVSASGVMYPCPLFQFDNYGASSLFDDSLESVLKKILPIWSKLQRISLYRGKRLKECDGCPGRQHCYGGCMGRALAAHRILISKEDRCPQRQAIYHQLLS